MSDGEAVNSLRDILAKSPIGSPSKATINSPPNPSSGPATSTSSRRADSSSPTPAMPLPISPSTPILQYPAVNVPGSSPKPSSGITPSNSPLKNRVGNFFKSFKGRSIWDADDDEFGNRAYTTATLGKDDWVATSPVAIPSSRGVQQPECSASEESIKASSGWSPKSPFKHYGVGFFKSFRGRSAFNADEDEFGDRKYTTATLETDKRTDTQLIAVTNARFPNPSQDPTKNVFSSNLTSALANPSNTSPTNRDIFRSSPRRSASNVSDDDFEHRKYIAAKVKKGGLAQADTPSPRIKLARKVSWADQANANALASSDDSEEQAAHSSKDAPRADTDSASTLSLNSSFDSNPELNIPSRAPTPPRAANPYKTIHKSQAGKIKLELKNLTLAASRDLSPFKGSIWDPEEDEWADVDAYRVAETFRASYKDPGQYSPRKANALSRFGSSVQDAFGSLLTLSPTKNAANERMREEEQLRDQLEVLGNTYYCDPEGDLCDEVMKQTFVGGSRFFDSRTLARSMHVIDLEAYFGAENPLLQQAKPRLCDAVATILSHTSQECLADFLDPTVEEFAYRRELDRNKAGSILIIRRQGNKVFAGAYRNLGFTLQWTLYVKSLISITGQWHEVYATPKPGLTPIVDGVPAWDKFSLEGTQLETYELEKDGNDQSPRIVLSSPKKKQVQDELSPTDPKHMLYQSRHLAKYLLWDIWFRFDGLCECRASWEADGEVTDVRLKRALVGFGQDMEDE